MTSRTRGRISLLVGMCLVLVLLAAPAWAGEKYDSMSPHSPKVMQSDDTIESEWDEVVKALKLTLKTLLACEDVTANICVVEERYLTIPTGGTDAMVSADQLYKSGPGYVRSMTCYSDATATAGTIALRDNTAAGAGNILWSFDVLAIAYNTPFTVDLQTPFSIGLYLDFTTTADMKCMVRWRG